ncbi:MAG: thiopurine S-methyltransferase [Deltaproteobacteria bacterium]|nr:thiopurine S-methyltransferase [Deltaproteobacteria bacterium]
MEPSFWQQRWAQHEIGFHEGAPNEHLQRFGHLLGTQGRVFVPLCGKSHDLDFLSDSGFEVTGCELVSSAVEAYFAERDQATATHPVGSLTVYTSPARPSVRIACGDVFAWQDDLGPYDAVFDRAALVALTAPQREAYAKTILAMLKPRAKILLVSVDHDLGSGPPHEVSRAEIELLYGEACTVELLTSHDALPNNQRFADRGATRWIEHVYLLTARA